MNNARSLTSSVSGGTFFRRTLFVRAIWGLGVLALATPAFAQTKDISASGTRFLEVCSVVDKADRQERLSETDVSDIALCAGFTQGVHDGVMLSLNALKQTNGTLAYLKGSMEDLGICAPSDITLGQEVRIALKYIREHPEQAHLLTAELMALAEFNAFPCEKPVQKQ